ncbi:hypothetical protein JJD66_12475 [Pseudomonas sp. MF6751]|uniref:hypothetical protein n=1 Tax=Pseudomonas sp. MF6751 TaxID=2797528 RepID=UPI00190C68AA|nr:hypothetical protein [Pseudomonas sp. MF6751]MBK3476902.1 hypothetical protein [Pseudomonas sp. MF6751]
MSIAGIRINQAFNNDALTIGGSLADSLIGDSHLINWFQADARSVTLEGSNIIALLDRKGTASAFTRAGAGNSPVLTDNIFGIYPGARLSSAESDRAIFSGTMTDLALPFTWAGVATLRTNAATSNLLATFTSTSVRCILNATLNTSALKLQYGTASTAALGITLGQPFAFAAGFDGVNIFLMVNGILSTVPAAGAPSLSDFALGGLPGGSQFWDGDVSDIFISNVALNSAGTDSVALLSKIRSYIQSVYGLTL